MDNLNEKPKEVRVYVKQDLLAKLRLLSTAPKSTSIKHIVEHALRDYLKRQGA